MRLFGPIDRGAPETAARIKALTDEPWQVVHRHWKQPRTAFGSQLQKSLAGSASPRPAMSFELNPFPI